MQIVIDIDEKDYQLMKNGHIPFNVLGVLMSGTPLPKGHGRLIDVSNLLTVTDIREDGTESTYVPYEEIEDALTIIEADKEEKQ